MCSCGQQAGRDGRCRRCRLREFGQSRRIYHFTPELRDELRRAYCGKKGELTAALNRLHRKTGWPRHAFKAEAIRLGLTTFDHRRFWTGEEIDYLREKLGVISVTRIARNLGRTVLSVESKAEKLGISRRVSEGYNMADLQVVFGESAHKVRRWMERGMFGKVHKNNGKRINEENVVRFLRRYPHEYDLRRVDQEWFKGMVFGTLWQ